MEWLRLFCKNAHLTVLIIEFIRLNLHRILEASLRINKLGVASLQGDHRLILVFHINKVKLS